MLYSILYLVGGLFLLLAGGHYLVNAGVSAAQKLKIAPFVVGATVVAFGTSAPELLVSLKAAAAGHPEMALGNVIGSNIANIALVIGATACLITLPVLSKRLLKDWLLVIFSSMLLILFTYNGKISHLEGGVLLGILLTYIYSAIKSKKEKHEEQGQYYSTWKLIILVFFAAGIALAMGAHFLVQGAKDIAQELGVSERVISITMVALGTSLPELTTSVIAALKRQTDISIGNIIGSNLFNILAVIGITALFKPLSISFSAFRHDLFLMLLVAFMLMVLIYPYCHNFHSFKGCKKIRSLLSLECGKLNAWGGVLLLCFYVLYIYCLFL